MSSILTYLVGAALAATLAVLLAGVIVMAHGGELNRKYGNKLMRLRVIMQATAIVLFVILMLVTRG